jgi:OFA family oxalate/formate antiporter-like MFS transporter
MLLAISYTSTIIACVLLYGIGVGFSQGLPYMLPMNNAYKYFPNKKGLISGICMAGLGFGALVFNQLILSLLNPNNVKAD